MNDGGGESARGRRPERVAAEGGRSSGFSRRPGRSAAFAAKELLRRIAWAHLRRTPLRLALTAAGVAFGIALWVGIQIINRSTLESFEESIEAISGKAKLSVSAGGAPFDEAVIEEVSRFPGVRAAVPLVETRAYLAGDRTGLKTLVILGVDMLKEQAVRAYRTTDRDVIEDPLTFLNQPDSIIVTRAFAEKHGLRVDSSFEVASPSGPIRLVVRGLLDPEGPAKAYGGSLAIMDIDGARMTFRKEGKLDRIDIVPKNGADVEKLEAGLRAKLGAGWTVEKPESRSEQLERMARSFRAMLEFFGGLSLIGGVFLVSNTMSMAVAQRRREIGILRAIGGGRGAVLLLILGESAIIGVLGSLAGVVLGRWLAERMLGEVGGAMIVQLGTRLEVARLHFSLKDALGGIALGTLVSVLAGTWPAWLATRVSPLEAMKRDPHSGEPEGRVLDASHFAGILLFLGATGLTAIPADSQTSLTRVASQLLSVLSVTLLAPIGVKVLARVLSAAASRRSGWLAGRVAERLAVENVIRHPRRIGNNVRGLAVGLVLVMIIAAVSASFRDSVRSWLDATLKADLVVSSQGMINRYLVQPLDEELGAEIARLPGVRKPPYRAVTGMRFLRIQHEGREVAIKAYDAPDPSTEYRIFDLRDADPRSAGKELFESADLTGFVSRSFTANFGKGKGDVVELASPTGPTRMRILATVQDFGSPVGVIYLSREKFSRLWGDRLVSLFGVVLEDGVNAEAVQRDIQDRWGRSRNVMALLNREIRESASGTIDRGFAFTWAIQGAALLIALLGFFNTLLISMLERTREIGLLRAVGMARRQVLRMVLGEALLQGCAGSVASAALGGGLALLFVSTTLEDILGWSIDFSLPVGDAVWTIVLGASVALAAAAYPALRASRMPIREALEYE